MNRFLLCVMGFGVCLILMAGLLDLVLDAAIREQEFNDNIRHARCARMDNIERNVMRGYCK